MAVFKYKKQDLYYGDYGSGKACLLFIHGLGGDNTLWKHQIDYFQNRYRVIAVDLFGHGNSSRGVNPKSALEFNTCAINGLISEIVKMPTIAIAHSLAGPVILEVSKSNPSGLKGLVFADSTYFGLRNIVNMHVDFSRRMLEWPDNRLKEKTDVFYDSLIGGNVSEENQSLIKTALAQCDPRWLFEYAVSCGNFYLKHPPDKSLADNNLSVLIVEAGHGVGNNFAKSWINFYRTADYFLFENSDHYLFIEKSERFNKLLNDFIAGIR
jgi:pimeloyl-ACP methyl ester carboxylesterase